MRTVNILSTDERYNGEYDIAELCPSCFDELVSGRIFPDFQEMQYMMLALKRSKSTWCIEHGQALPCDTKRAIKIIESLPKYK